MHDKCFFLYMCILKSLYILVYFAYYVLQEWNAPKPRHLSLLKGDLQREIVSLAVS